MELMYDLIELLKDYCFKYYVLCEDQLDEEEKRKFLKDYADIENQIKEFHEYLSEQLEGHEIERQKAAKKLKQLLRKKKDGDPDPD